MAISRGSSLRRILAANLRKERMLRAWSQEEAAERAGISQTYISQMESAQRAVSLDVLEKVAQAFELDADQLLRK